LQATPADDRKFQRYFTLANLHNTPSLLDKDLKLFRLGLVKLINSLSWQPALVMPRPLPETQDTVLVIDLRKLGWDKGDLWSAILRVPSPYALAADEAEVQQLRDLAGTPVPCVRADWFVYWASRPPLYHQMLNLPETAAQLEKQLGINFRDNFLNGTM